MQISDNTKEVLKNFAEINQNLLVNPGKKLSTISTMKNILAKAEIEEEFPQELGIYDLHEFLGVLGLFKKPELKFDEKNMTINDKEGPLEFDYMFSDPSVLVAPTKDIKMPPVDVSFTLPETVLATIKKTSAVAQLPDISVIGEAGGKIYIKASDSKNTTSHRGAIPVGDDAPANFTFHFRTENFKLIDGDYDVDISKSLISHFKHRTKPVEYWIALEQTSKYGG